MQCIIALDVLNFKSFKSIVDVKDVIFFFIILFPIYRYDFIVIRFVSFSSESTTSVNLKGGKCKVRSTHTSRKSCMNVLMAPSTSISSRYTSVGPRPQTASMNYAHIVHHVLQGLRVQVFQPDPQCLDQEKVSHVKTSERL